MPKLNAVYFVRIDESISTLLEHSNYKESTVYLGKC